MGLKIIGAGALLLQTGYGGGTKDSDIFETASLTPPIQAHLLELAGPETTLAKRHRMYAEIVRNGIPFLRGTCIGSSATPMASSRPKSTCRRGSSSRHGSVADLRSRDSRFAIREYD